MTTAKRVGWFDSFDKTFDGADALARQTGHNGAISSGLRQGQRRCKM